MNTYTITPKGDNPKPGFAVEAESYEEAANLAVKTLYGHKPRLVALRTTGTAGKSGIFQGYVPHGTAQNTFGHAFHVL